MGVIHYELSFYHWLLTHGIPEFLQALWLFCLGFDPIHHESLFHI